MLVFITRQNSEYSLSASGRQIVFLRSFKDYLNVKHQPQSWKQFFSFVILLSLCLSFSLAEIHCAILFLGPFYHLYILLYSPLACCKIKLHENAEHSKSLFPQIGMNKYYLLFFFFFYRTLPSRLS